MLLVTPTYFLFEITVYVHLVSSKITCFLKAESCWYPYSPSYFLQLPSFMTAISSAKTYWCSEYEYDTSPCFFNHLGYSTLGTLQSVSLSLNSLKTQRKIGLLI